MLPFLEERYIRFLKERHLLLQCFQENPADMAFKNIFLKYKNCEIFSSLY